MLQKLYFFPTIFVNRYKLIYLPPIFTGRHKAKQTEYLTQLKDTSSDLFPLSKQLWLIEFSIYLKFMSI